MSTASDREKFLSELEDNTSDTPLIRSDSISAELGIDFYVKREDLCGYKYGFGGSKLRKLVFIMREALEQGADTIVVSGNLQSNHVRHTAYVCNQLGLECHCILQNDTPSNQSFAHYNSGNILLSRMYGAKVYIVDRPTELTQHFGSVEQAVDELTYRGRNVYVVNRGGSKSIGDKAYVQCAEEIVSKLCFSRYKIDPLSIYVCAGSGGTHAGLALGLAQLSWKAPDFSPLRASTVIGVCNKRSNVDQLEVFNGCVAALGDFGPSILGFTEIDDRFSKSPRYGEVTAEVRKCADWFFKHTGIMLDTTYSVKPLLALLDDARSGLLNDRHVIFVNGGTPISIFAYLEDTELL
jgi:D-cysteine desulfhydrase